MSDQPLSELPELNPYAPPASPIESSSSGNPLLAPAIILLTLSVLTVLLNLAALPGQIIRVRAIDTSTAEGTGELIGMIVGIILWPAMNVAIALGSISMIRLKGYRSAFNAAILAVIPVCSPCLVLGIPFGIWSIVLLNRPAVKQRFTAP